jgi:hypothetical protein
MLDRVSMSFQHPSSFLGARPQSLILKSWPPSQGCVDELATLLPSVRSLTIDVESASPLHTLRQCWKMLDQLVDLTYLVPPSADDVTPLIFSWAPHLQNLRYLRLSWTRYMDILLDEMTPMLRLLDIRLDDSSTESNDLSSLRGCLSKFSSLSSLTLSSSLLQVDSNADESNASEHSSLSTLESLKMSLPRHLHDMKNVFIRTVGSHYTAVVPALGYFFVSTSAEAAESFFLSKLVEVGIDSRDHPLGDSTLCFALSSQSSLPSKVRRLLAAGADLTQSIIISGPSNLACIGSLLHRAVILARPAVIQEFLSHVDWNSFGPDSSTMRTNDGFTPLHFAATHFESWIAVYEKLVSVCSGCLDDSTNVLGYTPLKAVHSDSYSVAESKAVPQIARFILSKHSNALSGAGSGFLPFALRFYKQLLSKQPVSVEIASFFGDMWSILRSSPSPDSIALSLGELLQSDSPDFLDLAVCALMFHEPLYDFIAEPLPSLSSRCLAHICSVPSWHSRMCEVLPMLKSRGANINSSDSSIHSGLSPLCILVRTFESHRLIEPRQQPLYSASQFWTLFWRLTSDGATFNAAGERQRITTFLTPSVLRTATFDDLDRLWDWCVGISETAGLVALGREAGLPHLAFRDVDPLMD